MINPDELKPAREWLNYLPEPIKSEAIEACEKWPCQPSRKCDFYHCVSVAFYWSNINETDKWGNVIRQLKLGKILPVSLEAEPYKPMTDHEAQIAQLRAEIAAMRKIIEMMKAEPTPAPEPKQVKLPVTIEEVMSGQTLMQGKKSFIVDDAREFNVYEGEFNKMKLLTEFRTEKAAKKALAFLTLLKIAEAQNEVVERGEIIHHAILFENAITISSDHQSSFGQIKWHSFQGLRDCIAANEQLWKDYLEI